MPATREMFAQWLDEDCGGITNRQRHYDINFNLSTEGALCFANFYHRLVTEPS